MNYAEVVVNTPLPFKKPLPLEPEATPVGYSPLGPTFHYSIPPALQDLIAPGHLVRVPFGPRFLQGFVLALHDISPVAETREIAEIYDTRPVLQSWQIELARWLSQHYLAPLRDCLLLMLPPGLGRRAHTWVEVSSQLPQDKSLTSAEADLLEYLKRHGPARLDLLAKRKPQADVKSIVGRLAQRGYVLKRSRLEEPRVRPKRERLVVLKDDVDEEALDGLKLSGKQEEIIDFLLESGEVPVSQIYTEIRGTAANLRSLDKKGLIEFVEAEVIRDPLAGRDFPRAKPPRLVPEQEAAWQRIAPAIASGQHRVFLLHGVTGSGKTEVYLRALEEIIAQGKQAIVLVPEIALTPQTVRRFGARFPKRLAVMHSQLSAGERYDTWRRARDGEIDVIIGSRSAVFAPLPRLGFIVVDEEHEWSYKQERTPRYHARDVAVRLGELIGAAVILGSATPDLESYYKGEKGFYEILNLPQRIMGHRQELENKKTRVPADRWVVKEIGEGYEEAVYMEMPPVQVVDLRQELKAGNTSIFSRALQTEMRKALDAEEQVMLFLNRRGAATFVLCRDCGYVATCRRCHMPMTLHLPEPSSTKAQERELVCHHCNRREPVLRLCPNCGSQRIRFFGLGTQRVEEEVGHLFPQARTVRWDRDTTRTKASHERILSRFINREAEIMIGTQMVAKGLDLPLVTLVGVVSADTALFLPDFRAGERTFQLLTQVAGRAGRSVLGGKVIIQTYTPQHYAIQAASRHDYGEFYRRELAFRRELGYPPFKRLVRMIYVGSSARSAEAAAQKMYRVLENKIARLGLAGIELVGPAPAFYYRMRGKHRWHLLIRAADPYPLLWDLPLPRGWRVDVDPVDLL